MATKKIVSEATGPVFNLPWLVARDEGLFAEVGIEVEFRSRAELDEAAAQRASVEQQQFITDPSLVSTLGQHLFEQDPGVEIYRACEWGQIARSHDSTRGGRIIGKRSAVASQAIIALPESGIVHPQDLRNRTVGVSFHHGSHYLAIQMLEGFLEDDEIRVVNVAGGGGRYEPLLRGEVDAVALMEPWITLAEKQGLVNVIEAHYVGSEIGSDDLDAETFEQINTALRKAVALINQDKRKYLHYFIESLPEKYRDVVTEDDFRLSRLRYVDPAPYPVGEFQKTYDWMVKWGLIAPDATFEDLVDNRIAAAS